MTVTTKTDVEPSMHGDGEFASTGTPPILDWQVADVLTWANGVAHCSKNVIECLEAEAIDGQVLLALSEDDIRDFRFRLNHNLTFGELKKLWLSVRGLQHRHTSPSTLFQTTEMTSLHHHLNVSRGGNINGPLCACSARSAYLLERCMPSGSKDCDKMFPVEERVPNIPPEFFKTAISLGYSFLVTWITSFVMVIVHERVPDMKRYPPLPDIFLDNVPHIPWAFHMCEITGTLLFIIWACVCIFHKYRWVLLRRFFALAGTVFLLRCVTMIITSLSVPGTHLQCNQQDYAIDDSQLTATEALELRIYRAYTIWSGLGMSIQGVRTCGDYMFSGHTVALTLLNFFITEYTPRDLYFLHTITWLLNMFGIFFILAAHEHYSIDVFVAFYITSRLFLYYHTLANNQALMSRDSNRTRIWFPMFSYFESSVEGIIPNEYDSFESLFDVLLRYITIVKDSFMLTARRYWVQPPHLGMASKNLLSVPKSDASKQRHVATSTHWNPSNSPSSQVTSTLSFDRSEQGQSDKIELDADSLLSFSSCDNLLCEGQTSKIDTDSELTASVSGTRVVDKKNI